MSIDLPANPTIAQRRANAAAQRERRAQPRDWQDGWRAAREALTGEIEAAAYARGLRARPVRKHVVRLDLLAVVVAFIAGFFTAIAIATGHS